MKVRRIPGFPDYLVSESGIVFSTRRTNHPKRLKLCVGSTGYLCVNLWNRQGKHKYAKVHQLVALAWIGPRPEGHCVNHKDGVKPHNHATNLEYTTHKGNLSHALENGLRVPCHGSLHRWSKLTEEDVLEIRNHVASGKSQTEIALLFSVNPTAVSDIVTGKTWRHVCPVT